MTKNFADYRIIDDEKTSAKLFLRNFVTKILSKYRDEAHYHFFLPSCSVSVELSSVIDAVHDEIKRIFIFIFYCKNILR